MLITPVAPEEALEKKVTLSEASFRSALSNPAFYAELGIIVAALLLSWLCTIAAKQRIEAHLQKNPPKRIDAEFILKPLALLAPILTLILLALVKPLIESYFDGGIWIDAMMELTFDYLIARLVVLTISNRLVAYVIATVIMARAIFSVTGLLRSTLGYLRAISFDIGTFKLNMLNLLHGVVIFIVVFWGAAFFARTLESYLRRSSSLGYNTRELIVKFFRIFVYFIAFIITLSAMGVDLTAFAVFGGALGVGIGLGLQKLTSNFVSGVTLLMEKSIKLGDLIEVGGVTGNVRQLNIRYALIETADGRELLIPNEELITSRVTNWTYTNERGRIDVTIPVAYGTDAKLAQKLMLEAAREHPLCQKTPVPSCFLREFGQLGMNFLLTFWIPNVKDGRMAPQSDVMLAIMEKFKANGIKIPFTPPAEVKAV